MKAALQVAMSSHSSGMVQVSSEMLSMSMSLIFFGQTTHMAVVPGWIEEELTRLPYCSPAHGLAAINTSLLL